MAHEQQTIRAPELVALANVLHQKNRHLTVRAPLLDLDLFVFDPHSGRIVDATSQDAYERARRQAIGADRYLDSEIPDWRGIQDAMQSSGLAPYRNADEQRALVQHLEEQALDASRPKLNYVGLDTNALYHRWATRHIRASLDGRPKGIRFVLSKGTEAELDAKVKAKYGDEEVALLKTALGHDRTVSEFRGKGGRANRRAQNGLGEYEALIRQWHGAEATCERTDRDKEENDRRIAQSYADFEQAHRCEVVLVTADNDMATHAENRDVQPLLIQYDRPDAIPLGPIDETVLCAFIHDLAVEHLAIHIPEADSWLWSDWNPKRRSDWAYQRLLFRYAKGDPHAEAFVQDLRAADMVRTAATEPTQVRMYRRPEPPAKARVEVPEAPPGEAVLSYIDEIVRLQREMGIGDLEEALGQPVPGDHVQTDSCIHAALLCRYARQEGLDEAAAYFAKKAQEQVLAMPGKDWVLSCVEIADP